MMLHPAPYGHRVHRGTHALLSALVVLAAQAGDAACQATTGSGYDCHVRARGLRNESGLVVDVLTHWCDPTPRRQTFTAWIVARPGPDREGEPVGRSATEFIPAGPKSKKLRVEGGRCQADVQYATAWQSVGVDARGVEFRQASDDDLYWISDLC